ncbi:hypothetical protein ACTG9Q_01015 [Actinokineospora sp. 24-640]
MHSHVRALADPWGLLLAGSAAAVGVAIHLPPVLTVTVGAAVWLGRAMVPRYLRRFEAAQPPVPPDVAPGSTEAWWLDQAIDAEADFDALVADGPLTALRAVVAETVTALYAIAEQATATGRADGDPADLIAVLEWATLELQDAVSHTAGLSTPADPAGDDVAELTARLEEIRQTVTEPSQVA